MSDEVFGDDFDDEDDFENRRSSGGLGGKRMLLIILVLVVIAVGAAIAAFMFTPIGDQITGMFGGGGEMAPASVEKVEPTQRTANADRAAGEDAESFFAPEFVAVPPLLVNLQSADARRRNRFLKLEIWIEVAGDQDPGRVENAMPKIVDTLQVYLRGLRVEELQGSAGIDRLRRDILIRVQKAAESFGASAKDILFKEILVQ